MAKGSYAELNAAVEARRPDGDGKDLDGVIQSILPDGGDAMALRGRIARALRMGDFNLFIVEGGVCEQAQLAAETLGVSPTLRFPLVLVQLRIYRVSDASWPWVVIPRNGGG